MTTSGTYSFALSNADIVLEAFDRCGIRPTAITAEHMLSARRSLNLELQTYSNRGINLWAVDQQTIPLVQGVPTYTIPADTITMLDTYVRLYQLPTSFTVSPIITTTLGSPIVNVNIPNNGMQAQYYMQFVTPVAIGGIVLTGYYQVNSVIDPNNFTIVAAAPATVSATGGVLAVFATIGGSQIVTTTLQNHGLVSGQYFTIGASTLVGGLTLFGSYQVATVVNTNTFTFNAVAFAVATQTGTENGGFLQVNAQSASVQPVDRILLPISRSDYAMIPNKTYQAPPTTYWYDRTVGQTVTLWQVPDGNGPYGLYYYRMRQLQDANTTMGQTPDIQYRFQDALCAGMAARLARKYAPQMVADLKTEANEAWISASREDRERVDIYIRPDFSSYYNK